MRKVLLAFVAAASLAGCSWMHHDQDRNMQGSGTSTSTPYPPQARAGEDISRNNMSRPDWNRCDQHPYMPGPARKCE